MEKLERKVTGVMVPSGLSIAELGLDIPLNSDSKLGELVIRELTGQNHYANLLTVLAGCKENGEFEYKDQRGRILGITFDKVEPVFANAMERIRDNDKPKIHDYHHLSWVEYDALGRPPSILVEEITRISPNEQYSIIRER